MTFQDSLSIVGTALAALGGGATIVAAFSAWLGKVWANRLMESEKAKYALELESVKAELSRASEDRTRRLQGLMRHYERQIEEFYGPLFNMVNQVFVANHVQSELLSADEPLSADAAEKVRDYFHSKYFTVFHDEITEIIRTKL